MTKVPQSSLADSEGRRRKGWRPKLRASITPKRKGALYLEKITLSWHVGFCLLLHVWMKAAVFGSQSMPFCGQNRMFLKIFTSSRNYRDKQQVLSIVQSMQLWTPPGGMTKGTSEALINTPHLRQKDSMKHCQTTPGTYKHPSSLCLLNSPFRVNNGRVTMGDSPDIRSCMSSQFVADIHLRHWRTVALCDECPFLNSKGQTYHPLIRIFNSFRLIKKKSRIVF